MLVLSRLNLSSPPFTFRRVQAAASSSKSSNDSWLSCQYGRPGIWQSRPTGSPVVGGTGTASIPHVHSIPPSWSLGSGGCANVSGIAFRFGLSWQIPTWKVLGNGSPFLRAKPLDESDEVVVFFSGPGSLFSYVSAIVTLTALVDRVIAPIFGGSEVMMTKLVWWLLHLNSN